MRVANSPAPGIVFQQSAAMRLLVSRRLLSLSVLSALALPPSAAALSTTNPPALTGLAESDLAINLGRDPLNLKFSPGQQMQLVYSKVASGSYGENDVQVFYDRLDGKIVTVNAAVYGTDAVSGREFLAYLASLPIQGISPAAAKAWVYRNYPWSSKDDRSRKFSGRFATS